MIIEKIVYHTLGVDYPSLQQAQDARFDLIGSEIVDQFPSTVCYKDRVKIAEWLYTNRERVREILNF